MELKLKDEVLMEKLENIYRRGQKSDCTIFTEMGTISKTAERKMWEQNRWMFLNCWHRFTTKSMLLAASVVMHPNRTSVWPS